MDDIWLWMIFHYGYGSIAFFHMVDGYGYVPFFHGQFFPKPWDQSSRFEAWQALQGTASNGGATLHAITEIQQLGLQKTGSKGAEHGWNVEHFSWTYDIFYLGLPQISVGHI